MRCEFQETHPGLGHTEDFSLCVQQTPRRGGVQSRQTPAGAAVPAPATAAEPHASGGSRVPVTLGNTIATGLSLGIAAFCLKRAGSNSGPLNEGR